MISRVSVGVMTSRLDRKRRPSAHLRNAGANAQRSSSRLRLTMDASSKSNSGRHPRSACTRFTSVARFVDSARTKR